MEQPNKINAYICPKLHATITVNSDGGTTPMFITCPSCGENATSRMYNVDQTLEPSQEWFKPTEKEVKQQVDQYKDKVEYHILKAIEYNMKEHVKKGGLLLRIISK